MAFGAEVKSKDESRNVGELLFDLEPEDLVQYGLIPEFVGRLPVIATLEELDVDALVQILTEPKNSLTKQYSKLFEMEGVEVDFREDGLRAIAEKGMERKTGARGCAPFSKAYCWIPCTTSRRVTTSAKWLSTNRSYAAILSLCWSIRTASRPPGLPPPTSKPPVCRREAHGDAAWHGIVRRL